MGPAVVFANELEAAALGEGLRPAPLGGALVVIKHGPDPAVILGHGPSAVEVPALAVDDVRDTTGAGDAFAAGVLLALETGADPPAAVRRGHEVAAAHLRGAATG